MKNLIETIGKITFTIIMGYIFFKLVEYFTNKIDIINYTYKGVDIAGNDVNIIWFDATKDLSNNISSNKKYKKYNNNKFSFKIYIKYFKNGVHRNIHINPNDEKSYDAKFVIKLNKHDLSINTRIKILFWLIKEYCLNKITKDRKKILPGYLIYQHIYTDTYYINSKDIYK